MNAIPENNIDVLTLYSWQKATWDRLIQKNEEQRLPHALLLQGSPDSGLNSFAQLFSNYLLCAAPKDNASCGKCRDCLLLLANSHPGFVKISPTESDEGKISKVIKIDQIREIIDFVTHTSMLGGKKVVVIYPAEAMNQNAANALLKSLEEPPANTQFLLVTNMPGKLLATIRSRCQLVDLPLPSIIEADQWLAMYIKDSTQRAQLLALSAGNPLLVKQWQDESLTADIFELHKNLGELLTKKLSPLLLAKNWAGQGAERIGWWWRWLLLEAKQSVSLTLTQKQLIEFMQKLLIAKRQLESSANPNEQLLLESLLIDWQNQKAP